MAPNAVGPISVVVPVYNSSATLRELASRVSATLEAVGEAHEVLLVDDGSRDSSWPTIVELVDRDPRVRGVRLSRNAGQVAACLAGVSVATGAVVVTIDADLENLPEDIPALLAAVRSGASLAGGRRRPERSVLRRWPSWLFNARLRRLGLPFRDVGCGLDAMEIEPVRRLLRRGAEIDGLNFKPAIAASGGLVVEVPVGVGPVRQSQYRPSVLVRHCLAFEVVHAPSPERRAVLIGLIASGGAAAARRGRTRAALVALASGAAATALGARSVRRDLSSRPGPLYEISEVIGGAAGAIGGACSKPGPP